MGCCNEPVSTLMGSAPDPTQHVNYARGMVLGVEDLTQEFAWLNGRDRWLAHDAIGYGTLSGLKVFAENDGAEGPRVHVTAGSALVPSGRQVCVPADQCCVLNRWLAKTENAAIVTRLLDPGSPPLSPPLSPPAAPLPGASGVVSLYLTLCWADCLTRPVPVPGEPCRSEDELMAPSRVADDFALELREAAPLQTEEDALRDFVRWLKANVQVVDSSPPSASDDAAWLASLRPAAQAWLDAQTASPPLSPPVSFNTLGDYLFDLSPSPLAVSTARMCDFLRVAFRFWVTELRPIWMAMRCHRNEQRDTDCLLLARVGFEVTWVGGSPTGAWQVSGSPMAVDIDETTRPVLTHLRMLQEWMMCGCDCAPASESVTELMPIGDFAPAGNAGISPVPIATVNGDMTLDESHYCVICRGPSPMTLTLPGSTPMTAGRVFIVKNFDVTDFKLVCDSASGDLIDDDTKLIVKKRRAVTVIADGAGQWTVISAT